MKRWLLLAIFCFLVGTSALAADYGILGGEGLTTAGDVTLNWRALERNNRLNSNYRGDDPFSEARIRVFMVKQFDSTKKVNVEFLWDSESDPHIFGAYLTLRRAIGPVGIRTGFIPSALGNYSTRSTYFNQNPVIGVPAIWHYKTTLNSSGSFNNDSIHVRGSSVNYGYGIPVAYDACWNFGSEFFIDQCGWWDASLAVTTGSTSNPLSTTNLGYQKIARIAFRTSPALRFGFSSANSSWIRPDAKVKYPKKPLEYYQNVGNAFFEAGYGHWQWFGEAMHCAWQTPFIKEGTITATGGYLESRWNFYPGYYWGLRLDRMQFSDIAESVNDDSVKEPWTYNFNRIETALAWRVIREGVIRLDYQGTYFDESHEYHPIHFLALQWMFAF
ncbi:MAG: hypothetical protein OEM52_01505 [bacterium]|nr:hypothetical protein [bacterium]